MSSAASRCHPDACPAAGGHGSVRRPTRPMFRSLLIANRGEIARRINTVARGMGLQHRRRLLRRRRASCPSCARPTEAVRLGPAPAKDSYLNVEALLDGGEADRRRGQSTPATASSPRAPSSPAPAREAGITFVGPPPEAMARMKDKSQARKLVAAAGVPVVPGTRRRGRRRRAAAARGRAHRLPGAVQGGGRRRRHRHGGRRRTPAELEKVFRPVHRPREGRLRPRGRLPRALLPRAAAHRGADPRRPPRPRSSTCLERECCIQRRHQKVVEEAGRAAVRSTARNADAAQRSCSRRRSTPRRPSATPTRARSSSSTRTATSTSSR